MARHTSPEHPAAQRALITLVAAGAALGAGAATASADSIPAGLGVNHRPMDVGRIDPQSGLRATTGMVHYVTGPVAALKPNPLAGTGVDPLDNGVGTQLADFKPVGSQTLTRPVAQAPSVGSMPVLGQALEALGH
ncbi:hypothetical protein ACIP4Y_15660 [Streptomyces sp. NPDC088810]|uniref:hypothetical protein n=1 Tax=unclassified Streptomyces TaxID=2593676 RepID=UPI0034084FE9